jgi:hypothetical protein
MEGGSIRAGAGCAILFSCFGASVSKGRSGARSAFGPVGGKVERPGGIAAFGAVGTTAAFTGVTGVAGVSGAVEELVGAGAG